MKNLSIRQLHQAFADKTLSAVELTQSYLLAAKSSRHHAILTLCEERALNQAKAVDELLSKQGAKALEHKPLLGIPIGIKDALTIEGVRTTCGSKILENYIPPYTSTAVARLESAGAVILGKLNMDEFAMGSTNENSAFGPVQHPTHPGRVPGGSSGGSATAVRAGLCVAALGSDTGGSIRLPAAYCGIVGVKPTYGRISRFGLISFAPSLDQVGPMTRSVEDAARLLDVLSGHDPKDSTSWVRDGTLTLTAMKKEPEWKRLKIGIPKEYFAAGIHPEVEEKIQESLRWFERKGATLIPISLPHTAFAVAAYYVIAVSEASSNLARMDGVRFGVRPSEAVNAQNLTEFYKKTRAGFGPEVKRRIMLGTFALSAGYSKEYFRRACQVRRKIKQDFDSAFDQVDLIAGPVSPTTALKSEETKAAETIAGATTTGDKSHGPLQMYLNDVFTTPANLAGLPALSVPCGSDREGLPVGLQLMAAPLAEEKLFSVAHSFYAEFEGIGELS